MYLYRRGLTVRGLLEVTLWSAVVAMKWLARAAYVVGLQRSSLLLSIITGRIICKEGDFRRRMLAGSSFCWAWCGSWRYVPVMPLRLSCRRARANGVRLFLVGRAIRAVHQQDLAS